MRSRARQHLLATFFVLAFAFTWALLPFAEISLVFSFVALFGPAAAAFVTAWAGGRESQADLRQRTARWRARAGIYLAALLLPFAVTSLRSAFELAAGAAGPVRLQPVSALSLAVFVLVVGEEIGWRGFALPRLLERFGPWKASAILGFLWALWHLPLFYMSGMPQFGTPFASYVPYLISLSVLLTVLAQKTGGSVPVATIFHGAVNTLGFVTVGADAVLRGWSNAFSYGVVALVLGAVAWRGSPASSRF